MQRLLSHPTINPHPSSSAKKTIQTGTETAPALPVSATAEKQWKQKPPPSPPTPAATETTIQMAQDAYHGNKPLPSTTGPKQSHSHHIADQALTPTALSRKPTQPAYASSASNNTGRYQFSDQSLTRTPIRNSLIGPDTYADPAMDPSVRLEDYDWLDLEDQFAKRMEAFRAVEEGIWEEWRGWGEVFGAWASTISVYDEERAAKRLRTRIAFTQGSEESLEAKRLHYIKVVQAFESALALLSDG